MTPIYEYWNELKQRMKQVFPTHKKEMVIYSLTLLSTGFFCFAVMYTARRFETGTWDYARQNAVYIQLRQERETRIMEEKAKKERYQDLYARVMEYASGDDDIVSVGEQLDAWKRMGLKAKLPQLPLVESEGRERWIWWPTPTLENLEMAVESYESEKRKR